MRIPAEQNFALAGCVLNPETWVTLRVLFEPMACSRVSNHAQSLASGRTKYACTGCSDCTVDTPYRTGDLPGFGLFEPGSKLSNLLALPVVRWFPANFLLMLGYPPHPVLVRGGSRPNFQPLASEIRKFLMTAQDLSRHQPAASDNNVTVPFVVKFQHRLRFTRDLFAADSETLLELLETSEGRVPRVQFWMDEHVANANPELKHRIRSFCQQHSEKVRVTGNIQILPGGEDVKNDIHIVERMLKCFNHADLDRRSYVVAIGGGAVLDAVGFAAAIAHRGIRLIRIPTTTLAQGDSGIGVKNSINLFQKKNWVGTFAVPWGVINDRKLTETLSDRDFRCGFSEAVKVSLLKDADFFRRIHESAADICDRNEPAWSVIAESAKWHLKHITEGGDPFEMLEARPLDYGHWSAHKLETMTDFGLRHGEAVAIGVAVDTVYSSLAHGLPADDAERVLDCLDRLGLLMDHPALHDTETLFGGLEEFRQHLGGRLTITMLKQIGSPINVHSIDHTLMREAISHVADRVTSTA
ncbi:3-dehydroquinate synthase [Fuerstiella marisgermanici]|uniref:3-dehydroquinate synthase n=2 Tax=Fuerstiella marisgermanici TaxID=1891926 RepID=A0A1P8WHJ9_9PLAN|nr:3-dehydroquinate synthase [Fuerstiella marisgermanici]